MCFLFIYSEMIENVKKSDYRYLTYIYCSNSICKISKRLDLEIFCRPFLKIQFREKRVQLFLLHTYGPLLQFQPLASPIKEIYGRFYLLLNIQTFVYWLFVSFLRRACCILQWLFALLLRSYCSQLIVH